MVVGSFHLIAEGDSSGLVEFAIAAFFIVSAVGSSIVAKLRERNEAKKPPRPVIPPPTPEQRGTSPRPTMRPPAGSRPPRAQRPIPQARPRPHRPMPPAPAARRSREQQRQRDRAILLGEQVPPAVPQAPAQVVQAIVEGVAAHAQAVAETHPTSRQAAEPGLSDAAQEHTSAPAPGTGHHLRQPRIRLRRNTLRDAIIYAEVLGRPVGDRPGHLS